MEMLIEAYKLLAELNIREKTSLANSPKKTKYTYESGKYHPMNSSIRGINEKEWSHLRGLTMIFNRLEKLLLKIKYGAEHIFFNANLEFPEYVCRNSIGY